PRCFSKRVVMMEYCCAMSWTCATCGLNVDTRHCPSCGEKRLEGKALTLLGVMSQGFQSLSAAWTVACCARGACWPRAPASSRTRYIATAAVYEASGWPRALKVGLL